MGRQLTARRPEVVGDLAQQVRQCAPEVRHCHPGVFEASGRYHDQVDKDPARGADGGVHHPV